MVGIVKKKIVTSSTYEYSTVAWLSSYTVPFSKALVQRGEAGWPFKSLLNLGPCL